MLPEGRMTNLISLMETGCFNCCNYLWGRTISKGMVEENEQPIAAAIRELREETNIDLNEDLASKITDVPLSKFQPFTSYKTNYKTVLVFLLDDKKGVLIDAKLDLKCTSLIDNPANSRVAHLNGLPEMDAFMVCIGTIST